MKKIMLISLVTLVCIATAAPAFAEETFSGMIGTVEAVTTIIGGGVLAPSTGVTINISATDTLYTIVSLHASSAGQSSGKQFGCVSSESTIKYVMPAPSTITSSGTAGAWPTGVTWTQ